MVILLRYTAFIEVIYADFYAKILDWNFRLVDENNHRPILVVVFVSKMNFSFSFRFVDENCRIFVVVVVFVTKTNLFSSTKIFVFVVADEKKHCKKYAFLPLSLKAKFQYAIQLANQLESLFASWSGIC